MATPHEVEPWVDAALEEFKVHRIVFQEALATAQRTLAFGATAVGILIAGAFNVWDSEDRLPPTLLFMGVVPLVSILVVVQRVGQMSLLSERDRYLRDIESELRAAYRPRPSTFFNWADRYDALYRIGGPWWKPDRRWQLNAAMPVFGVLALGSLVLGFYRGFDAAPVAVALTGGIEFLALAAVLIWQARIITSAWAPDAPPTDATNE